jgi:hypothetical protein
MASLFDIFKIEQDGRLVLKDTLETMARAKLRIKALRIAEPADYVIYSQETGQKTVMSLRDLS